MEGLKMSNLLRKIIGFSVAFMLVAGMVILNKPSILFGVDNDFTAPRGGNRTDQQLALHDKDGDIYPYVTPYCAEYTADSRKWTVAFNDSDIHTRGIELVSVSSVTALGGRIKIVRLIASTTNNLYIVLQDSVTLDDSQRYKTFPLVKDVLNDIDLTGCPIPISLALELKPSDGGIQSLAVFYKEW